MLKNPIFFIGMPRSGTTILFEALSNHNDLAYMSNYTRRFSWFPYITFVHRFFGNFRGRKNQRNKLPLLKRVLPEPSEVYNVWEHFFGKEFSYTFLENIKPDRDTIHNCITYICRTQKSQGKNRFAAKFTGPPRIDFLSSIFEDSIFIDIVRDPRAVIASLLKVDFWKNRGLYSPFWEGGMDKIKMDIWEQSNKKPAILAAMLYLSVIEHTEKEIHNNKNKYKVVRYEDFVESPRDIMTDILKFCGLGLSKSVENYLSSQIYVNMNYKYESQLEKDDIALINEILKEKFFHYGYNL